MKIKSLLVVVLFAVVVNLYSDAFAGAYITVVNVRDYGATGNGITDDTTAIRNAIAAAGTGTQPRIVFFPAGRYVITKPIFIGEFSSSGNGQGSFTWAGETRYWGGSIVNAKEGIHLLGETSSTSSQSEIVFKRTDGVSCPMFVLIDGRDFKFEKMQINGQYVADSPTYTRASEGIFATAGVNGLTIEQSLIKNCKRGYRGGNNVHWPEDPVTFTNYEPQGSYPTTTGGWIVDQIVFTATRVWSCDTCISQETAGTIGFQTNNLQVSNKVGGYGIYLQAGCMTLVETSFMGEAGVSEIYVPADCGTNTLQILGGHCESASGATFKKDRSTGEIMPAQYAFKHLNSGNNIEVSGAAHIIIDDGSFKNIDLLANADAGSGSLQILDIRNSYITGKVGQWYASYGPKVVFSAQNTLFAGGGAITTPFNSFFDTHGVNKIVNCKFTGDNFTDAVKSLNYQGIGVFSGESDGGSHFSLGASYDNTNTIYGAQDSVATLVNAYRKEGSLYAANTTGSRLVQGDSDLVFSVFSGDTADTTVDVWNERFAIEIIGDIWTTKVDGHHTGWDNAAPTSGQWSQGDVIWNTAVLVGGVQGWRCVAAGTPGTWDMIGQGTSVIGDLDNDGDVDFEDLVIFSNNWLFGK